jgi:hypothetical protein
MKCKSRVVSGTEQKITLLSMDLYKASKALTALTPAIKAPVTSVVFLIAKSFW